MCLNPVYLQTEKIFVPCRQCGECRMIRARTWAVRCYYELKKTNEAMFITLTYSPQNNPILLVKKDVQNFIKRFRKFIAPKKIKYFACGEYGPQTLRPHYHLIIFGHIFDDLIPKGKSKKSKNMYISKKLGQLWTKGLHTIQETNFATAVYTALYSTKGKKALPKHLQQAPEFNLMSQNIGIDMLAKDIDKFLQTDEIYIQGQRYNIPDAVLKKLFVINGEKQEEYVRLKEKRKRDYEKANPKLTEIRQKLIANDELIKLGYDVIKDYYKAASELNRLHYDQNYRFKKKGLDKTL